MSDANPQKPAADKRTQLTTAYLQKNSYLCKIPRPTVAGVCGPTPLVETWTLDRICCFGAYDLRL